MVHLFYSVITYFIVSSNDRKHGGGLWGRFFQFCGRLFFRTFPQNFASVDTKLILQNVLMIHSGTTIGRRSG